MIDINELSVLSGCSASKIRYYEELDLIRSNGRKGLRRLFERDVLTRLSLIRLAQIAGFSLQEIRGFIGHNCAPTFDRVALIDKAEQLDQHIKQLAKLRDGLRHIANCQAESPLECPRFKRIMSVALQKNTNSRRHWLAK